MNKKRKNIKSQHLISTVPTLPSLLHKDCDKSDINKNEAEISVGRKQKGKLPERSNVDFKNTTTKTNPY